MDIEPLLAPVSDAEPAGPDLEYDPDHQELERLAQGKPEQQFGDTVIPAEEPNWRDVAEKATELLGRSKDVRSACLLTRACVHLDGFKGLAEGLSLIHQLMERFWDSVHPQLDEEDDNDPTMRLNALAALADPEGLLRDVRATHLFQSRRHGQLTVRQVEVVAGKAQARDDDPELSPGQVENQLVAVLGEDESLADQTETALHAARELARFLDNAVGADRSPELAPLIATLTTVEQMVKNAAANLHPSDGGEAEGEAMDSGGAVVAGAPAAVAASSGAIRSRADVVTLLDKICQFLEKTEPTNPTPLLLRRAQRLMQMNFLELMEDLAPDGVSQVQVVVGKEPGDDDDDD